MATYVTYNPSSLFTAAMFNFDVSGVSNFRLTGTIRVSVSDGFATGNYALGLPSEVPWQLSNLSNIQDILGVFRQFANFNFATVVDYDTTASSSIADPSNVSPFDLSDINITFYRPSDPDVLGESSLATDRFGYLGSRGDIFLNPDAAIFFGDLSFAELSKVKQVLMHELGHSLGLSHPFVETFAGNLQVTQDFSALVGAGFQKLGFDINSGEDLNKEYFTIMSYDDESRDPFLNAYTPMILDVIALAQAYGEGTGTHGTGNDLIEAGNIGYRTYFDRGGTDTIEAGFYEEGVYIHLGTSITGADHLVGVVMSLFDARTTVLDGGNPASLRWLYGEYENANGGIGNDLLLGNTLANVLVGRSGNDFLLGEDGADSLSGDDGHDNVFGGSGSDTLSGGAGNDHIYGQSANGGTDSPDLLNGGDGSDYLQGNAGNDTLDGGDGSDRVNGGGNDDSIFGSAGNDTINGNLGNDSIDGGTENDSVRGGQGADSLVGNSGNDVLSGDLGSDTLTGGLGSDIFQFSGAGSSTTAPDRITDFTDGQDRLGIGYLPATVLTGASQFSVSGASSLAQQLFNGNAGTSEVAAIAIGSDTYIFYSSNGGATVDSAIQIIGVSPSIVTTTDFV
jgi:serralysin